MKLSDPNACDEELLECIKETCDQKLRHYQSRKGKGNTQEPMGDIESEITVSEAPTVDMTTATSFSPPQKKRRRESDTPPLIFNTRLQDKDDDIHTPQSETTSVRSPVSGPDNGPLRSSTPEGEIFSLHLERDYDSNSATMETKRQHTIHMDDVQAKDEVRELVGDWFDEIFNWDAVQGYEI
jgi:hypothetical protein